MDALKRAQWQANPVRAAYVAYGKAYANLAALDAARTLGQPIPWADYWSAANQAQQAARVLATAALAVASQHWEAGLNSLPDQDD